MVLHRVKLVSKKWRSILYLSCVAPPPAIKGASPFMASRRAVILTPSRSSHPIRLLSRQQNAPISPLAATLMDLFAGVANKGFTRSLSLLAATLTLTKNRGEGGCYGQRVPSSWKRKSQRSWEPATLT